MIRVEFEPGVYTINLSGASWFDCYFFVFDENLKTIKTYNDLYSSDLEVFKGIFEIKESGIYYIKYYNYSWYDVYTSITGFQYENYVDFSQSIILNESNTVFVEGPYDYVLYEYDNIDNINSIKITNLSKKPMMILEKTSIYLQPGQSCEVSANSKLFISTTIQGGCTYDFTVEKVIEE